MTAPVSIAMGTYQGERFLHDQLLSLARQTLLPSELVVSDDRSTDSTRAILEDFARGSPFPVRLHLNDTQLGVGDNFLNAASRCRGRWIAFCDQDDVWLPDKLARCADALSELDVHLAIHACRVVDEQLVPTGESVPSIRSSYVAPPLATHKWHQAPGMAMVFSRDLLAVLDWTARPRSHEPGRRLLHDEWIYGIARLVGRIAFLSDVLALYRQHGANIEGAPPHGLRHRLRLAANVGDTYYTARAGQARDWSASLGEAATEAADAERRARFSSEAASYARLASALEARASVHSAAAGRAQRIRRLGCAALGGAYASRKRDGFGLRGLLRDGMMVLLGRRG